LLAAINGVEIVFICSRLFELRSIYFSETVYQSIPIIDACLISGGTCPLLLDPGFPCEINRNDQLYSQTSGISERVLASARAKAKFYRKHNPEEINEYGNKSRKVIKNNSSIAESSATEIFYKSMSKRLQVKERTEEDIIINSEQGSKTIVILHLHAVTDGPYFVGYSGFLTPFDFFKNVIKSIGSIKNKTRGNNFEIILKPHPNILTGASSGYQSHKQKAYGEKKVSAYIYEELVNAIMKQKMKVTTVSTRLKTDRILSIDGVIHVTHHGAVSLEAIEKNKYVITTKISPAGLLYSNENTLFITRQDSEYQIEEFITGWIKDKSCGNKFSRKESSKRLAITDRYYGLYRASVNEMYKEMEKDDVVGLDTRIARDGYSFKDLDDLPLYLKHHFAKLFNYLEYNA